VVLESVVTPHRSVETGVFWVHWHEIQHDSHRGVTAKAVETQDVHVRGIWVQQGVEHDGAKMWMTGWTLHRGSETDSGWPVPRLRSIMPYRYKRSGTRSVLSADLQSIAKHFCSTMPNGAGTTRSAHAQTHAHMLCNRATAPWVRRNAAHGRTESSA
jgi:hypothetical protein